MLSDQTLGDMTIEDTNAMRGLIDESVDKLIAFFFSKVGARHSIGDDSLC